MRMIEGERTREREGGRTVNLDIMHAAIRIDLLLVMSNTSRSFTLTVEM